MYPSPWKHIHLALASIHFHSWIFAVSIQLKCHTRRLYCATWDATKQPADL